MTAVIKNIGQLATPKGFKGAAGAEMSNIEIINNAEILIEVGIIKAVGKAGDFEADTVIDAEGNCVIPGFIDSHTHFIFGGYREDEFLARLAGEEYLEILKKAAEYRTPSEQQEEQTKMNCSKREWTGSKACCLREC